MTAASGLLLDSSDPDGDPLVAALAAGPAYGALTVNADGSFVYIPDPNNPNPLVSITFIYQVSDGNGGTALATATLVPTYGA